jgi:hypothetical protein
VPVNLVKDVLGVFGVELVLSPLWTGILLVAVNLPLFGPLGDLDRDDELAGISIVEFLSFLASLLRSELGRFWTGILFAAVSLPLLGPLEEGGVVGFDFLCFLASVFLLRGAASSSESSSLSSSAELKDISSSSSANDFVSASSSLCDFFEEDLFE